MSIQIRVGVRAKTPGFRPPRTGKINLRLRGGFCSSTHHPCANSMAARIPAVGVAFAACLGAYSLVSGTMRPPDQLGFRATASCCCATCVRGCPAGRRVCLQLGIWQGLMCWRSALLPLCSLPCESRSDDGRAEEDAEDSLPPQRHPSRSVGRRRLPLTQGGAAQVDRLQCRGTRRQLRCQEGGKRYRDASLDLAWSARRSPKGTCT